MHPVAAGKSCGSVPGVATGGETGAGWSGIHRLVPEWIVTHPLTRPVTTGLADGLSRGLIDAHDRTRFARIGQDSRNAIVSFHGVGEDPAVGLRENVPTERFRAILEQIGNEAEFVPLSAVTEEARRQRVAITFDDGLRSVFENALPVLRDLGVPATVFVNPGLADDRDPERFAARHDIDRGRGLVVTDEQLRELAADPLLSIGNHTMTHADVSAIDDAEERRAEVVHAQRLLEERYGATVEAFAYPYGAYDGASRRLVERTHDVSVTTAPLLVRSGDGAHGLGRLCGTDPLPKLQWELTPASDLLHRVQRPFKDTATGPEGLG